MNKPLSSPEQGSKKNKESSICLLSHQLQSQRMALLIRKTNLKSAQAPVFLHSRVLPILESEPKWEKEL